MQEEHCWRPQITGRILVPQYLLQLKYGTGGAGMPAAAGQGVGIWKGRVGGQ